VFLSTQLGVDLLGPCFTSAGSVVAAHLEDATNAAAVTGFCEVRNSTAGKILLNARNGGVVESRVINAAKVWEREGEELDVKKVFCLDLNRFVCAGGTTLQAINAVTFRRSLYPSSQVNSANMYGEYTVYSPASENPDMLEAASNFNPYGNEYRSVSMLRHELEDRFGENIISMRSNHGNQRCAVLPRYWPDAFAVTKNRRGEVVLTFLQHDGYFHVLEPSLHHPNCRFNTPDNDFSHSPKYQMTVEMAEKHRAYCEAVFSHRFKLRFVQTTDCNFHSHYVMRDGTKYANMGVALSHIRQKRPELCISAPHPSKMSVAELLSLKARPDSSVYTGFVVIK
jgi:hypothetical protein